MKKEHKIPSPGESIKEVTLLKWLKNDGDFVHKDEELAEIESDKATLVLSAETDGKLEIKVPAGTLVVVGAIACIIDSDIKEGFVKPTPHVVLPKETVVSSAPEYEKKEGNKNFPSVSADKLMREKNIEATDVKGSGKDGRIIKGDVLKYQPEDKKTLEENIKQESFITTVNGKRNTRREKMTSLRKKIAERLTAVKNQTAMLTTFNEVDMSAIMELRSKYKDKFKEKFGVGLGFLSLFTRAVTESLKQFPAVNARIEADEIVYSDFVDMGIAVSTGRGLMVPVIRNAELLTLAEIEQKVSEYALKAREYKLSVDDMTGGTFTLTNGGVFGSMLSTPILNPPQSAILGMHNITDRPVARNGQVVIRPVMYLALSYDHRIIDGKESVSFLVKVKEYLENPAGMFLGI